MFLATDGKSSIQGGRRRQNAGLSMRLCSPLNLKRRACYQCYELGDLTHKQHDSTRVEGMFVARDTACSRLRET